MSQCHDDYDQWETDLPHETATADGHQAAWDISLGYASDGPFLAATATLVVDGATITGRGWARHQGDPVSVRRIATASALMDLARLLESPEAPESAGDSRVKELSR